VYAHFEAVAVAGRAERDAVRPRIEPRAGRLRQPVQHRRAHEVAVDVLVGDRAVGGLEAVQHADLLIDPGA